MWSRHRKPLNRLMSPSTTISALSHPVWSPGRAMPTLVFPGGHAIEIPFNDWLFLGHFPSQDIVLAARTVSGRHTAIRCALDGAVTVCDLGSANGTFLDGQRVRESVAVRGPVYLSIGPDVHLRIESRERERSDDGRWHPSPIAPQPVDDAAVEAIRLRTRGVVAALRQHFEELVPDAMIPLDEAFELHVSAIAPGPVPSAPYAPPMPGTQALRPTRTTAPGRAWSLASVSLEDSRQDAR
jgi:hypothetical protein